MEVSFYLTRPEPGKQTAVYAHIRYAGYRMKYYLPEKIDPEFWNPKEQRAKKTNRFPGYMEFNRRLGKIYDRIKDIHNAYRNDHGNKEPAPDALRAQIDQEFKEQPKKGQVTFLSFFQELIDDSFNGTRVQYKTGKPFIKGTVKAYVTVINHLKEYIDTEKKKIDFEDITAEFHADFTKFLIKRCKLGANSIGKDIKNIKMVMNEAAERGLHKNFQFKSKKFSVTKEDAFSIYLNQKELDEMLSLDLSSKTRLERVRDLFLIGAYTGLRYSDYSILKPGQIENGRIKITQVKTGGEIVIPIHPVVNGILDKYQGQLPKAISNQKMNDFLKEIGQMMPSLGVQVAKTFTKGGAKVIENFKKWELLTTHTARRSFATNEYLAGTPSITIMAITGHKTEKAFLKYIKLTPTEHAQKMEDLWAVRNKLKAV